MTLSLISRLDATPCMYLGAGALVGISEGLVREIRFAHNPRSSVGSLLTHACANDIHLWPCFWRRLLHSIWLSNSGNERVLVSRKACDPHVHYTESPIKYNFADFYSAARPSPYNSRRPLTVDMAPVKRKLFEAT